MFVAIRLPFTRCESGILDTTAARRGGAPQIARFTKDGFPSGLVPGGEEKRERKKKKKKRKEGRRG
jgi:hypothetical protein